MVTPIFASITEIEFDSCSKRSSKFRRFNSKNYSSCSNKGTVLRIWTLDSLHCALVQISIKNLGTNSENFKIDAKLSKKEIHETGRETRICQKARRRRNHQLVQIAQKYIVSRKFSKKKFQNFFSQPKSITFDFVRGQSDLPKKTENSMFNHLYMNKKQNGKKLKFSKISTFFRPIRPKLSHNQIIF